MFRVNVHDNLGVGFYWCAINAAIELITAVSAVTGAIKFWHDDRKREQCLVESRLPALKKKQTPASKIKKRSIASSKLDERPQPKQDFDVSANLTRYTEYLRYVRPQ